MEDKYFICVRWETVLRGLSQILKHTFSFIMIKMEVTWLFYSPAFHDFSLCLYQVDNVYGGREKIVFSPLGCTNSCVGISEEAM